MMNVSNQNSEEMQRDLENLAGDDELVANPRDLPAVRVVSDVHMPNCLKGSASKPAVVVDDGKIHDDYLQGRVTPELLKHFKEDEALELVKYFYQTPSTPTQCVGNDYCLENLSRENLGFL